MRRTRNLIATTLALGLIAAACGSDGDTPDDAAAAPDDTVEESDDADDDADDAAAAPDDEIDPLEPYPSADELEVVRMAVALPALAFAPVFIAEDMNFFEYNGVEADFVDLQAGATLLQAVIGGSLDLGIAATAEMAPAVAQGLDLVSVQNTILMTMQVCVRDDWAADAGVGPDSSIEERMAALEGATIGVTAPGSASDRNMRWLLETYGGLNPDTDVEFIQVGGPAMAGATDENQVQAFLLSSPNCQQTEMASVLVEPTEVPEYENFIHEVVYGDREWVEANPDLVEAVTTAVTMGNNFILDHPDRAFEFLQARFDGVDPDVLRTAFDTNILPVVPRDGIQEASQWDITNEVMLEAGFYEEPLDTTEGVFWTNDYLGDATLAQ